jgi:hypothetical protein
MANSERLNLTSMNPAITVVLVVGNYRDRAQRVLRSVLAQDIADQIVILFYDRADRPARDFLELNHPNVKYEAVDKKMTLGELQKRGILAATSEIVGLVEEHVAVPPNWARESLRLHAEGYAGVTGVFAWEQATSRFQAFIPNHLRQLYFAADEWRNEPHPGRQQHARAFQGAPI